MASAAATTTAPPEKEEPQLPGEAEEEEEEEETISIWEPVAEVPIPDDAWEYHIRRSLNDAAFQGLAYRPYCPLMPTPREAGPEDAKFIWVKKGGK